MLSFLCVCVWCVRVIKYRLRFVLLPVNSTGKTPHISDTGIFLIMFPFRPTVSCSHLSRSTVNSEKRNIILPPPHAITEIQMKRAYLFPLQWSP